MIAVKRPGPLCATSATRWFRLCTEIFEKNMEGGIVTMGVGECANDVAMLKSVDIPVLLPHDDGSYEDIDLPNLMRADRPGSRGWSDVVYHVLRTLQSAETRLN